MFVLTHYDISCLSGLVKNRLTTFSYLCYNTIMFTGIVEETGILESISGSVITVKCKKVLENTGLGDSISINGCCQTVVKISSNFFSAVVSSETLNITNFKTLKKGDIVNLERALTPASRLGGHIVQGHIDCTAKYLGYMKFQVENSKYIVYKGAITVNGVSLTVSQLDGNVFSVAVIPHTLENTNLKYLKTGDLVNIETDILGRYVEKFLSISDNKIDENFLAQNGFM